MPAVRLKIESFAGGVGGDEDAERMLARVRVEGGLNGFAVLARCGAVVDRNAVRSAVRAGDGGVELLEEVALGVVVLGKYDDPEVVPAGRVAGGPHVLPDPLNELA